MEMPAVEDVEDYAATKAFVDAAAVRLTPAYVLVLGRGYLGAAERRRLTADVAARLPAAGRGLQVARRQPGMTDADFDRDTRPLAFKVHHPQAYVFSSA
jgi:hypothetical protein